VRYFWQGEKWRNGGQGRARQVANRRARANSAESADAMEMEGKLRGSDEWLVGGGTDL